MKAPVIEGQGEAFFSGNFKEDCLLNLPLPDCLHLDTDFALIFSPLNGVAPTHLQPLSWKKLNTTSEQEKNEILFYAVPYATSIIWPAGFFLKFPRLSP